MKKYYVFSLIGLLIFLSAFKAPNQLSNPQYPYYVVIGAFEFKKNAVKFTNKASSEFKSTTYAMNPDRKLYYVYMLKTNNREEAIAEALRLQATSSYNDTWVYGGPLGNESGVVKGSDTNPVTKQTVEFIKPADSENADPEVAEVTERTEIVEEEPEVAEQSEAITETAVEPVPVAENTDKQKNFFFKIYRADNNSTLDGNVDMIDVDRSRKLATYEGNKAVAVTSPGTSSENIALLCEVFGYRKVQKNMNFGAPEGDDIVLENNTYTVPFELARLQKGDIAVMYNVYFFKDAAVMRPESRWEVNSLLNMLNENPKYKIKIHGHTNGGASGKIISKSDKSDNFFALTNTKEGYGSAKKLSQERAEIIRDYLLANGIDASRMQVKAWGGKRPIIDKMHTQAQNNVRVEIEILEN
ncbi:MAG: OmpA family protein [Cyclobacteriaceae bacterium]|nr:OmpA family protein [Cyclobacteriaceae bacterium]